MTASDEAKIAELFNRERLWTPTLVENWDRPDEVRLFKADIETLLPVAYTEYDSPPKATPRSPESSELQFVWNYRQSGFRKVSPSSGLLERFMDLADAPDEKIRRFAERFGPLRIFSIRRDVESCDIWRYFARAMLALLKIAAQANRGAPGSIGDWRVIAMLPETLHRVRMNMEALRWTEMPEAYYRRAYEEEWYAAASEVTKFAAGVGSLTGFVNMLLALGNVRPWMRWPEDASRPRIVYSSPELISYLALQLALRVTKMDAFVLCTHCQKEYTPTERAPKKGQRNFCQECRAAGMPKKYAISDYRERKGSVKHGKTRTE